jgi:DNA-binding MarR family transcriptional regulator
MMSQTEPHWQLFAAISGIYVKSRRITESHLKPYRMTWPQFGALFNLVEQDNITQAQLSERLLADQNTTMVLCNSMERKKWVTRGRDPSDKRVNRIVLTEEGRQVFQEAYPLILEEYKVFTDSISEEEISIVLPILQRLYAKIDERYVEVRK